MRQSQGSSVPSSDTTTRNGGDKELESPLKAPDRDGTVDRELPKWRWLIHVARTILCLLLSLIIASILEPPFRFLILFWYRRDEARRSAVVNTVTRLWGIWSFAAVRITLGLRVVVEGKTPVAGRYLVISNHQSSTDIPLLISQFRKLNLKFVAMEELRYGKPAVSLALRNGGHVFVAKEKLGVDLAELTKFGAQMEKYDGSPMIFPEGKRTEDGSVLPWYYAGIEAVRRSSRLPLLVVTIDGLWKGRTLSQYYKTVGSTVTIRISDPIPFEEVQRDPRRTYQAAEALVRDNLEEMRGGSRTERTEAGTG